MSSATDYAIKCPYCGSPETRSCVQWTARSNDPSDAENVAVLDEHQCMDEDQECCGRSFWL